MNSEPSPAGSASAATLFSELVELDPTERAHRLDALRTADPRRAAEVERLLLADEVADGPLERLRGDVAAAAERRLLTAALPPPERLGPWRLTSKLGEGGMGEVWLGLREEGGFEQQAAIKIVRAGMASASVLARFRVERQVLARLNHPAIARLLDGGVAPDGRPWFAMELVAGEPITAHAASHQLSVEARLRLMIAVCRAVDFAHRSLIVHRDLKPSNLLVGEDGEPKLLDFGLAKLLEPDADTSSTRTELRVLTPAYAAPEQVLGEPITTATDVYALATVLFELLTGLLPHRRESRSGAALEREIERETVERPSSVARRSGGVTKGWARRLEGDLDVIILQALRREPERRYPSAAALAEDLQRVLAGRPIAARADALGYRVGKFVRRNRVAVTAATLVVLSLVVGLVSAMASARRAERQARRAGEVQKFLVGLFEAADPEHSLGAEVSARQLLDAGVRQLEGELRGEPEVQAALFDTLAQIEHRIGRYESAERLALGAVERRATLFGDPSPEVAEARLTLAETLFSRGELEAAGREYRSALAVLEQSLDPDAEPLARARTGLAEAELYLGNNQRALDLSEQVLTRAVRVHGEEHPITAAARLLHGQMLDPAGRLEEALAELERATQIFDRTLGEGHPRSCDARLALAEMVGYLGDRPRAHRLFEQATTALRGALGDQHLTVAQALLKHALVWINDAQPAQAERALQEALSIFTAHDHFEAASCERLLGHSLLSQGRTAEAAARFTSAYEKFRARLGDEHTYTLTSLGNVGLALVRLGESARAVEALTRAIAGLERLEGAESDSLRQPLLALGEAERTLGRYDVALGHHRRVLAIAEAGVGAEHIGAANAGREIALDLAASGTAAARAEALAELERAIMILKKNDPSSARLADWLLEAGALAAELGDTARAEAARREALVLQEQGLGAAHPRALETRRLLELPNAR